MTVRQLIQFLFQLSICLLVLIGIEGFVTFGAAFNFKCYGIVAWISQVCY